VLGSGNKVLIKVPESFGNEGVSVVVAVGCGKDEVWWRELAMRAGT
jgi:hypothetical protein